MKVQLTHAYRTRRSDIGTREDIFWIHEHGAALARRAAEDGFKVGWERPPDKSLRQTRKYNYWGRTGVLVLDGPLTADVADAAAPYRERAESLVAELDAKGEAHVPLPYTGNALLPGGPTDFLFSEIDRLASEAGLELQWFGGDDISSYVRVVERPREEPTSRSG